MYNIVQSEAFAIKETGIKAEKIGLIPDVSICQKFIYNINIDFVSQIKDFFDSETEKGRDMTNFRPQIVIFCEHVGESFYKLNIYNGLHGEKDLIHQLEIDFDMKSAKNIISLRELTGSLVLSNLNNIDWEDVFLLMKEEK